MSGGPWALRVGPLDQAQERDRFRYIAIDSGGVRAQVASGNDRHGLKLLADRLDGGLVCDPSLAEAAGLIGLPTGEPDPAALAVAADIALLGARDHWSRSSAAVRHLLLGALGACRAAPAWVWLAEQRAVATEVRGEIIGEPLLADISISRPREGDQVDILLVDQSHSRSEAEVWQAGLAMERIMIRFTAIPAYPIPLLTRAYGLDAVPIVLVDGAPPASRWFDRRGAAVGAALAALARLTEGAPRLEAMRQEANGLSLEVSAKRIG